MTYYVETYRPPYTEGGGLEFRVHSQDDYSLDALHPCVTAVWEATHVNNKQQAVALVLEAAAGAAARGAAINASETVRKLL